MGCDKTKRIAGKVDCIFQDSHQGLLIVQPILQKLFLWHLKELHNVLILLSNDECVLNLRQHPQEIIYRVYLFSQHQNLYLKQM